MQPILIDIGGLSIYAYGFFLATAYLLGMAWAMREAGQRGLDQGLILEFGLYVLLGGLIGSRVLHVILNPETITGGFWGFLRFWDGGLVFLGGVLAGGGILVWYLLRKNQEILTWLDALAPGVALGVMVGWVGCFFAGCGFGKPSDLPWAVTFTHPDSMGPLFVSLHPTQIYHVLAALLVFAALLVLKRRLRAPGQLTGVFFVLYSVFRIGIDFFRDDHQALVALLSTAQAICLILLAAGLWLLLGKSTDQRV